MNTIFENVVSYESEFGKVYILQLNIKEFSDRFNVPIKYISTSEPTTAFEPQDLGVYMNFAGDIEFNKGSLILKGELDIFEGSAKLQRQLHPETDVIVRIFDKLNDDQIRDLLKPHKLNRLNIL